MNIVSGFEKGFQAIGSAISDASEHMAQGISGSVDTWMKNTGAEFDDVGQAFREGNLLQAGGELAELLSPGVHVSNTLDAFGLLDAASVRSNILSAWINGLSAGGSPVAWLAVAKDLGDVDALAKSAKSDTVDKAKVACRPSCPDTALAHARHSQVRGYARGDRLPSASRTNLSAAMERICLDEQGREACIRVFEQRFNCALAELPFSASGTDCRHKALECRTALDILNDSSLCFEDKVAMFMAKVMEDMQEEVTGQMQKMASMQEYRGKETHSGEPQSFSSQYTFVKDSLAAGNISESSKTDLFQQALNCIRPVLPSLCAAAAPAVGTAVGAAIGSIVPGAGTAIGGAIGGIVSAALPAVVPALFDAAKQISPNDSQPLPGLGRAVLAGVGPGTGSQGKRDHSAGSVQMEMERLKLLLQRMQQMQQACSNALNTMHNGTMNVVRNIR